MTAGIIQPEPAGWDAFVEARRGHLLQLSRWGRLKSAFGWRSAIVAGASDTGIAAGASMLFRPLPLGLGTIAYAPRGPVVSSSEHFAGVFTMMERVARDQRAAFLTIEPDLEDTPEHRQLLAQAGFRPSPRTIQPPRTILLDLRGSDEDILARMNQGTRRKIKTASKREIVVRRGEASDLSSYSQLVSVTGERDGFGVHSADYYRAAFDLFAPDNAALFMASYQGRDLAGLLVFALGKQAWYLYGASSNEERERMPNYALQWEAMRWARQMGCETYDLWGIPDADEATLEAQFQTRSDGLWGVYGFKRGFGGRVWRSVGAWDQVYNPLLYFVYRAVARTRD